MDFFAASVARELASSLGGPWTVQPLHEISFCQTWRARGGGGELFIKSLPLAQVHMLQAEADGLQALAATRAVRVPAVRHCGAHTGDVAVLALEWLPLRKAPTSGERLAQALAALHQAEPAEGGGRFGWRRDNFLGATPQDNRWSEHTGLEGWLEFFAHERLGALRTRLTALGETTLAASVDAVAAALPVFFADGHMPRASLIHGDLWSGNWGCLADGTPVIYDPAVSCSDAEAELAMMELFGAPPAGFWPAYQEAAGVHTGYVLRRGLYQLYHLLNHALLFGGGYPAQAQRLARALLQRSA